MPPVQAATGSAAIRVALVEDDEEFRRTILEAVATAPDMEMCGSAGTLEQAWQMLEQPPADVLVVDLGLPDGSGIEVIGRARQRWPACQAMVSTTYGDEGHVMRALQAGAYGYLLKDHSPRQLLTEIRSLHAGGSPVSPLIARHVLTHFHQSAARTDAPPPAQEAPAVALSTREREVLGHVTKGFTAHEIADLLQVSHHTVQTYVRRIYEKLNVRSRSEAIYEASHLGLLKDGR